MVVSALGTSTSPSAPAPIRLRRETKLKSPLSIIRLRVDASELETMATFGGGSPLSRKAASSHWRVATDGGESIQR